jgi:hypothetical protein
VLLPGEAVGFQSDHGGFKPRHRLFWSLMMRDEPINVPFLLSSLLGSAVVFGIMLLVGYAVLFGGPIKLNGGSF